MSILDKFKADKKPTKNKEQICYFPLRKHDNSFKTTIIQKRMYIQQNGDIDLIRVKEKESMQIIFKTSCYKCGTEMLRKPGKTKTEHFFECPSCKNVIAITFESIMKKIDAKTRQEILQTLEEEPKEKSEPIEEEPERPETMSQTPESALTKIVITEIEKKDYDTITKIVITEIEKKDYDTISKIVKEEVKKSKT